MVMAERNIHFNAFLPIGKLNMLHNDLVLSCVALWGVDLESTYSSSFCIGYIPYGMLDPGALL